MRLYGKESLKKRLDSAAAHNRLSHAVLIHGEQGAGKKVMARYIAKLMTCGAPPCESCRNCRLIDSDSHPDVIFVKQKCGGKYAREPFDENFIGDSVIAPNNGGLKIYIIEDCDDLSPILQNTMLKLIEEPAPYLRFIFTCENVNNMLETILSRVTEYQLSLPTVNECAECLRESGCDAKTAAELSDTFSGNIGKCRAVIDGGEEKKLIDTACRAAAAVARRDKFSFAAALTEQSGRAEYASVLEYLTRVLRDAMVIKCGGSAVYFAKKESAGIAAAYSEERILEMTDAVFFVNSKSTLNLNLALTTAYLTSLMM